MTTIPWVKNPDNVTQGRTINEFTGCLNHKDGWCLGGDFPCYAYRLASTRLKQRYCSNTDISRLFPAFLEQRNISNDPFYPRLWPEKFDQVRRRKVPTGWFHCDMSDWLGIGVPEEWSRQVYQVCEDTPWHRHYLLTKQAHRLSEFSPYPPQCWVGVTVTTAAMVEEAVVGLAHVDARIGFVSYETLLEAVPHRHMMRMADWVIIGACTGTRPDMEKVCAKHPGLTLMPFGKKWSAQPDISWVRTIVEAADKAGIPVFLKDNLRPLLWSEATWDGTPWVFNPQKDWPDKGMWRQELP